MINVPMCREMNDCLVLSEVGLKEILFVCGDKPLRSNQDLRGTPGGLLVVILG